MTVNSVVNRNSQVENPVIVVGSLIIFDKVLDGNEKQEDFVTFVVRASNYVDVVKVIYDSFCNVHIIGTFDRHVLFATTPNPF